MADTETTTPESAVQVYERKDTIIGQPQSQPRDPHDGATRVHEVVVHTDKHILDPNSPLAVQVPEGSGASTVDYVVGLADSINAGTAEEQFRAKEGSKSTPAASDSQGSPQASSEAKAEDPAPTDSGAPANEAKTEDPAPTDSGAPANETKP